MFFTREDILKIQNALLQLSVKDSELPSAEPVTYDDTLSIVQDSKNKKIKIKDFLNQISLLKREDFINITDKYDEHYISLIEAINLVPVLQRKDGLVITFQDIEGNWEIYQFRGNITEFFNIEKWFNLYDYRNNIVQSIVPDEEDLTVSIPDENGNSLVSLKDRVYDSTSFSGKGYKILRKNIQSVNIAVTKINITKAPSLDGTLSFTINGKETQVTVSATTDNTTDLVSQKVASALQESMTEYKVSTDASLITLTRKSSGSVTSSAFSASTTGVSCSIIDSTKQELRNILTPIMMNQSNTIYEIRYDYTLAEDITIPTNCILKFNGGSISGNYTLTFFNTLLCGEIKLYTRFNGNVLNKYFNIDDFSNTDDITNALQDIVNITNVVFSKKDYITTKQIDVPSNRYIRGVNGTKIYNETSNTINIIGNNVTIESISFESKSTETFAQYIIYVRPTHTDINIHHCNFEKATGGIFTEYEVQNMRVSDCVFDNMVFVPLGESGGAGGYGICISHKDEEDDYTWGGKDLIFTNNTFKEGVYRHCFYIQSCENVIISNNIMYGKNHKTYSGYDVAINVRGSKNLTIQSNILNNGHALYNCVSDRYYGQPSNIIIKDNSINNTQAAIYKDLGAIHAIGKNYLIDGNVFNDTGKYDIRIDNAEGITISNNIMNKSVANISVMILSSSKDVDIINNSFNGHSIAVKVFGGTMNNISICHNRMNTKDYDISFEHYSIVQNSKMIIDENIGYREFQIVELTELNKLKLLRITNNQFKAIPSLSNLTIDAIFIKDNSSQSSLTGGRNFGSLNVRPSYISSGTNEIGFMYFNTTTGIPNFWNGTAWVDATGTTV